METKLLWFGNKVRNILLVYIAAAYSIDYSSTIYGTSLGIQENNPLITNLMGIFGLLAIPVAVLIVGGMLYLVTANYKRNPTLVILILSAIMASETFVVSSNLLSISHRLANLSQV